MQPSTPKGVQRRQQVLDAAGDVLLRDGLRALTHRRVAGAAGVALGTTTYYFTGRDDLARAALEHLLRREQARRAQVTAADTSARAVARAVVELLVPGDGPTARDSAAVVYERLGEAFRIADLRTVVDQDYADLERHVARVLHRPDPDAARVLALAEGRLLRWLASDSPLDDLLQRVEEDVTTLPA